MRCRMGILRDNLEKRCHLFLMNEYENVPVDLPPELEVRIQKIMDESGRTRDEVIQRLLKIFFREVDHPSANASDFALAIRRALQELRAGG